MRIALSLVFSLLALALPAQAGDWSKPSMSDGITISTRAVTGGVKELRATGLVEARPESVFAVLADVEGYTRTMPNTEVSRLLAREGNVLWQYAVMNPPVVSRRDFCLRVELAKKSDGTLRISWVPDLQKAPPARADAVRLQVNEGSWELTPVDGGTRTRADYTLKIDLGGSIPGFLAERANKQTVVDVFKALGKAAQSAQYRGAASPVVEEKRGSP